MSDDKEPGTEVAVQRGEQMPALQSIFAMAVSAAREKDIDAEKMKLLVELATTQQDREAERRFRIAKQRALMEMPSITKRGAIMQKNGGVQSRYSKFEDMNAAVKPILSKYNLTISFDVDHKEHMVTVQPILSYADDDVAFEERGGKMLLAVDTTGSKNSTQGAGSAASYGKRHSMKAMLNIVEAGEDDDGQSAGDGTVVIPPERQSLIDDARAAAKEGSEAYERFFNALDKDGKSFLYYSLAPNGKTYHEQNKDAASLYD